MFPNVRGAEPDQTVRCVPVADLPGELLSLAAAARKRSGTKLERRMTELERARISERIKEARVQAGLTQEELADLLHVRSRTIANYEAGRVPWRLLGQIAEATGRTQEWLLHGEPAAAEATTLQAEVTALREQVAEIRELLVASLDTGPKKPEVAEGS